MRYSRFLLFVLFLFIAISVKAQYYMHEAAEDSEGGFWDGIIGAVILFGGIWLVGNISSWYSETKKYKDERRQRDQLQNNKCYLKKNYGSSMNGTNVINLSGRFPIDNKLRRDNFSDDIFLDAKEIDENNSAKTEKISQNNEPVETEIGVVSADGKILIKGKDIEYIKIPDGVEVIEKEAFHSFKNLCEVTLPTSIKQINNYAFALSSIKIISIPASVNTIEEGAFFSCEKLVNVYFYSNTLRLGNSIFWGCISLVNVKLPDALKYIPDSAFERCISLQNIIIPNTVIKIGKSAFCDCYELKEIELPDSVTYIGGWAFRCCYELKYFKFPPKVVGISEYMFCDDFNLRDVELHDNVTCIMDFAFANCSVIHIKIPESVNILEHNAFSQCCDAKVFVPSNKVHWIEETGKLNSKQIEIYESGIKNEPSSGLEERTKHFLYEQKIENDIRCSAILQELGLSNPLDDYCLFDKDDFY